MTCHHGAVWSWPCDSVWPSLRSLRNHPRSLEGARLASGTGRERTTLGLGRGTTLGMTSRPDLRAMARSLMIDNGFEPEFPPDATAELAAVTSAPPALAATGDIRDLRQLFWSSIDNDTSRDLDQVEVAEAEPGGVRVRVGIADVDAYVAAG